MKKMIKSSSIVQEAAMDSARKILSNSKKLLDIMDSSPTEFLAANDLMPLYDELIEVIPALDLAVKTGTVDIGWSGEDAPWEER